MPVRLRLRRIGKKKNPIYQIVAADARTKRDGKFLEIVGRYEPQQKPVVINASESRVFYWLKSGAQPTTTVRSLLRQTGLWMKWSMKKRGDDDAKVASAMEKWTMIQAEKEKRQEARKARRKAARKQTKTAASEAAAPASPEAPPAKAEPAPEQA